MRQTIFATVTEARSELFRLSEEGADWYHVEYRQAQGDYRISERPDFRIVRYFASGKRRTIRTGLTRSEAVEHCSDPETSSHTATSSTARARTRRCGRWFDGFTRF